MSTEILNKVKELISLVEQYFSEKNVFNENWLMDFALWLEESQENYADNIHNEDEYADILIGMQLINIANKLKTKLNRFVMGSPFAAFLDYQFLYILKEHGQMTKSELIFLHNMEMSSGIEVIKRLLKQNWIEEKQNPDDGRSKLIMITETGNKLLSLFSDSAREIYTSFSRDFDKSNKRLILQALYQLNAAHNEEQSSI